MKIVLIVYVIGRRSTTCTHRRSARLWPGNGAVVPDGSVVASGGTAPSREPNLSQIGASWLRAAGDAHTPRRPVCDAIAAVTTASMRVNRSWFWQRSGRSMSPRRNAPALVRPVGQRRPRRSARRTGVPASPSAGLSPIRRRPSRPSPDRACTTGSRRGIAYSYISSLGNSRT